MTGELRHARLRYFDSVDPGVRRDDTGLVTPANAGVHHSQSGYLNSGPAGESGSTRPWRLYTSTRSIPPSFARAMYFGIQSAPSSLFAISTTM